MSLKRITFNFEEELIDKIEEYAKQMHVNRTAAASFIITQYFMGLQLTQAIIDTNEREKERK